MPRFILLCFRLNIIHISLNLNCMFLWNVANCRLELAQEKGIAVTAYSSFGPMSFRELQWKKAHDTKLLFESDAVKAAAKVHGRTPAQVLLRWATQRGVAVIPKSNDPQRLKENLDVNSFELTKKELDAISSLDQELRFNDPSDYSTIKLFA
jgi:D-xylose reductase